MKEETQLDLKIPTAQFVKFEAELKRVGLSKDSMIKFLISEWLTKRGVK